MNYLQIRELYHSNEIQKEKARLVSEFEIYNKDFYEDLPYIVRNTLDELTWRFRKEEWFLEAWEKYRSHVLESGLGGEIKMPGYIFKPYLERYVDEHYAEFNNGLLNECRYSDMEIGEYLSHHGITGQKWGKRRYQYEDGTLTPEGKARYNKNAEMNSEGKMVIYKKDGKYYYKDTKEKDPNKQLKPYKSHIHDLDDNELKTLTGREKAEKENIKNQIENKPNAAKDTRDILSETSKVLESATRAMPTGNGKYVKKDYSDISDQELRERISRLQLEESYGRLSGDTKYVKSGSEKAKEILQTSGAIIAIGAALASLGDKIIDIKRQRTVDKLTQSDNLVFSSETLAHHGIKGQKWGVRRWQEESGTLTPEGRERYRTNVGTKEILNKTDKFDKLTRKQRKEYTKYGKISGAKKGFLVGAGAGAAIGIGKTALDMIKRPDLKTWDKGTSTVNKFVNRALKGALVGAAVGTLIGSHAGKKSAQAHLAEKGKEYTDQLLNESVNRIK